MPELKLEGAIKKQQKKYFVGDWDYIIESSVFIRCQEVMSDNKHLKRRKSSYTWLSGVVKCGCCGGSFFIPKGSIAKYRKFYCNNKYKKGLCNESKPISVSEIEDDITNQIFRKHALNISTMEFNDKKRILLSLIEKIQVFPDKNIVIWKNN